MEHFTLFFFNDAATTEIYTLSLHDALPIWLVMPRLGELEARLHLTAAGVAIRLIAGDEIGRHTSELQSRPHLVCRLLLEKKKYNDSCKRDQRQNHLISHIPLTPLAYIEYQP